MSDTDNPYAAPESFLTEPHVSAGGPLRVEGELICVGDQVHLPEICVVSGETTELVQIKKKLAYAGPVVLIAFLVSPLIGLILYMIMKKQTSVTMYMNQEVRTRRRWNMFYGIIFLFAAVGLLVGLISTGAIDTTLVWLVLPFALLVLAIVFMAKGGSLLSVKKYEKPGNFWLRGVQATILRDACRRSTGDCSAGFLNYRRPGTKLTSFDFSSTAFASITPASMPQQKLHEHEILCDHRDVVLLCGTVC